MFGCEAEFCLHRNKHGQKGAIEFFLTLIATHRWSSLMWRRGAVSKA